MRSTRVAVSAAAVLHSVAHAHRARGAPRLSFDILVDGEAARAARLRHCATARRHCRHPAHRPACECFASIPPRETGANPPAPYASTRGRRAVLVLGECRNRARAPPPITFCHLRERCWFSPANAARAWTARDPWPRTAPRARDRGDLVPASRPPAAGTGAPHAGRRTGDDLRPGWMAARSAHPTRPATACAVLAPPHRGRQRQRRAAGADRRARYRAVAGGRRASPRRACRRRSQACERTGAGRASGQRLPHQRRDPGRQPISKQRRHHPQRGADRGRRRIDQRFAADPRLAERTASRLGDALRLRAKTPPRCSTQACGRPARAAVAPDDDIS